MTMSCICVVFEKQIVLRTKRLIRVRKVRCLRSIFCVFRLPGLCTSGSRCRMYAPLGRHRARCLTVRLPMPPVRPVRETFASYGSRQRDIMGKVHFASSTVHAPWTALRVRWVPVYCFPTLSLRAFAMCAVFPHSDYYALFDCLEGLGVSYESPHAYSPPSFTSLCRLSRVYHAGLKQDGVGGVLLAVPSTLCGSPALCRVRQVDLHRPCVHENCGVRRPLFSTIGVLISVGWLTS